MTLPEIYEKLNDKLKVRLTMPFIREWILDDNRTIILDRENNILYVKYEESPLPYSMTIEVCENYLKQKFNK